MRVNDVEKITGLPAKTIKYYESRHLISPHRNSTNLYREYSDEDVRLLKHTKLLRKLGFSIEKIRTLLSHPNQFTDIFTHHIKQIDADIEGLQKAKEICHTIVCENADADQVDYAKYLRMVYAMEKEGCRFMDENAREKKFKKDSLVTLIFLGAFALLVPGLFYISSRGWISPLVALLSTGMLLVFLVVRHSTTTGYICRACGERFDIGPGVDFVSPHFFSVKLLKCPHCGKRTWARESYRK